MVDVHDVSVWWEKPWLLSWAINTAVHICNCTFPWKSKQNKKNPHWKYIMTSVRTRLHSAKVKEKVEGSSSQGQQVWWWWASTVSEQLHHLHDDWPNPIYWWMPEDMAESSRKHLLSIQSSQTAVSSDKYWTFKINKNTVIKHSEHKVNALRSFQSFWLHYMILSHI